MTIRFLCPHGHKLAVPDNLAGKKGRCPVCQQRVYIPMLASADVPAEGLRGEPPPPFNGVDRGAAQPPEAMIPASSSATFAAAPPPAVGHPPFAGGPDTASGEYKSGPPPIPSLDPSRADGLSRSEAPAALSASDWPETPPLPPPAALPGEAPQELGVIIDEPEGYQADPGKLQTAYMLAAALGALTLLCAAPALRYVNLMEAPNWARVVLIASALQLIFVCWMVSLPDWSTVWICMVVFAVVAALYGVAWAVITFTPDYMAVNFLDLDDPPDDPIRRKAGAWCLVILMLATLLTYACGRFSGRWRKQYELAKAMRE